MARSKGKGMGLLSHCEIGAAGLAIISFFGAIFAGFSLLASAGIAIGFVSYAFGKLVTGRVKECPIIVYVFAVLFVIQYAFVMPKG